MLKRILVFGIDGYYPLGGLEDLITTVNKVGDLLDEDFLDRLVGIWNWDTIVISDTYTSKIYKHNLLGRHNKYELKYELNNFIQNIVQGTCYAKVVELKL